MSQHLVIVLLVLASEANGSSLGTIVQATHEALGDDTEVVVERRTAMPRDVDARALEEARGARALVEVIWLDANHRRVLVRFHAQDAWIDREIAFAGNDDDAERGRTIGLAIATTLPALHIQNASEGTNDGSDAARPATADPAKTTQQAAPPADKGTVDVANAPWRPSLPQKRIGVGAGFVFSTSTGGSDAAGAYGSLGYSPWQRLWLQVHAEGRLGDASAIGSRIVTVVLGARGAWRPFAFWRMEAGLQVGAGAMRDDVTREIAGAGTFHRGRWVPVVVAMPELECRLGYDMALNAAIGPELALGRTRVLVGDSEVATFPTLRWVGQVGLGLRF